MPEEAFQALSLSPPLEVSPPHLSLLNLYGTLSSLKIQRSLWNIAWQRALTQNRFQLFNPNSLLSPHICILCFQIWNQTITCSSIVLVLGTYGVICST